MVSIRQIISILGNSIPSDNQFLAASGKSYGEIACNNKLPSQKRKRFGLLYDDLEKKFLCKPSIQAMLSDHQDWVCVPIYVYSDLEAYDNLGIEVCIQKIMFLMNGLMADQGSEAYIKAVKVKANLYDWLEGNRIKMVDEIDAILSIQDRFEFIRGLNSFLNTQPKHIKDLFSTPLYFEFLNQGSIDEKVTAYKKKAAEVGLEYPVLAKSKIGAKDKYAHSFFCINNDKGLHETLEFEGFDGMQLLIQSYTPHSEQVYKIYCIKDWFTSEIRLSLPESLILTKDAYAFDSQVPFDRKDFREFDPELNRLSPLVDEFVQRFSAHFGLVFFGIDILVCKQTGLHQIIDCNYLPNYQKVPMN